MRIGIVIIGMGNVGTHLVRALGKSRNIRLIQVYDRKKSAVEAFADICDTTTDLSALAEADIYVLSVSDRAIAGVSARIPSGAFVVHTSGSMDMDEIAQDRRGVLYPLQTFSAGRTPEFKRIPLCLETHHIEDMTLLQTLALSLGNDLRFIDSQQRKYLHLSAVFANNFVNHLWEIAAEICENKGMDFDILFPLMEETVEKFKNLYPSDTQTGPAARGDAGTVRKHLTLLSGDNRKLYNLLSENIAIKHGKKL